MPGFCIKLEDAGRKFKQDWIFRHLDTVFEANIPSVILGTNGTGKSTLIKLISGKLTSSEGHLHYLLADGTIAEEHWYRHIAMAAPYLELPEELTVSEAIKFQSRLKKFRDGMNVKGVLHACALNTHRNKIIAQLSSGMKQRLKLALAIYADTEVLLLDEPATNLDNKTVLWYQDIVQKTAKDRIIVVCSNFRAEEYPFAKNKLEIAHYKR